MIPPLTPRERAQTGIAAVAAIVCLIGEFSGLRALIYVGKPLATLAILALAHGARPGVSPRYRALVIAGLVFSLAGDVLLMLPRDLFIAGLASFLVAHLCYIAAFAGAGGGLRDRRAIVVVAIIAGAMLVTLWPSLGALRPPVAIYVAVISAMAWQAIARWRHLRSASAAMAAAGALSFLASDSALAVGRFLGEYSGSAIVVLGTYWIAQYLIARSVRA